MPSLLANAATLARSGDFSDRILIAVMFQARKVLAEPGGTANHTFRASFARGVLMSPESYRESFTWTMAADEELASLGTVDDMPEELVVSRVAAAWTALITPAQ